MRVLVLYILYSSYNNRQLSSNDIDRVMRSLQRIFSIIGLLMAATETVRAKSVLDVRYR